MEYGLSHNCPGPLSTAGQDILSAGLQAPMDGGLGYSLGEAFKIVGWDDMAIRRNAKDPKATRYAVFFWLAAMLVIFRRLPGRCQKQTRFRRGSEPL
jgi:hypothetical protein